MNFQGLLRDALSLLHSASPFPHGLNYLNYCLADLECRVNFLRRLRLLPARELESWPAAFKAAKRSSRSSSLTWKYIRYPGLISIFDYIRFIFFFSSFTVRRQYAGCARNLRLGEIFKLHIVVVT